MDKLKVLDLFSGIGGFSLGLERTGGFDTVAFCEVDNFCQKVLKKHWPNVPIYEDIKNLTYEKLTGAGIIPDVLTGGFPCQDISTARVEKAGITGARSGLWSEYNRLIGEIRPQYAIVENVTNLLSGERGAWFGRVLGDLAEIGYDAEWHCIPAHYVGAPHIRDRVWVVAYPGEKRRRTLLGEKLQTHINMESFKKRRFNQTRFVLPGVDELFPVGDRGNVRVFNGVPEGVDRIGACGNSIIPDIATIIGNAILSTIK